ncbi:unnamed protein product [Closterium sp. Naga37s-1]|nr:unnamed protein product [Closterium sp. Naga37s-1]
MGNSHSTAHSPHAHGRERGGRNSAANVAAADAGSADAGRTSAAEEGPPAAAEPAGSLPAGSESAARQRASGAAEGQRRGLSSLTAGLLSSAREHRGASRGRGWRTHGGTLALGAAQANGADAQVRAPPATRQPSAGTAGRASAGRRGAAGAGAGAGGTGRSTTAAAAAAAAAAVAAATAVDGEAEAGAAGSGSGAAAAGGRAAATGGAAGEAGGGGGGGGGRGGEATERGTGGGEGEGEQAAIQEQWALSFHSCQPLPSIVCLPSLHRPDPPARGLLQRTQTVRSLVNLRKHSVHLLPVLRRLQSVPGDQGGRGDQGERAGDANAAGGKEAVSEEAETEAAVEEGRGESERTQQHDGQQQQEKPGGNEGEASGECAKGVEEGVGGSVVKIPPLSYPADACLPASAAHLPPQSASAAAPGANVIATSASGAAQEAGEGDAAAAGGQGVVHPYVYGLSFIADCSVPCNVTVHVMAYEKDRHRKDKPPRLKSKVTQREASAAGVVAGLEQTFSLPPSCLLAFDGFQDAQLTSTKTSPSHTYPIVIRIQTALPAGRSHDPAARAQQQTHTTYATLVKQADSTYGVQVLKQVLWVGGCSYVLHEIFGIDGPASSPAPLHAAPGDTADPNGGGANVGSMHWAVAGAGVGDLSGSEQERVDVLKHMRFTFIVLPSLLCPLGPVSGSHASPRLSLLPPFPSLRALPLSSSPSSLPSFLPSPAVLLPACNTALVQECVVCLEDPRDTLVLPCRHLCLCLHCAKALRFQSNKCPIWYQYPLASGYCVSPFFVSPVPSIDLSLLPCLAAHCGSSAPLHVPCPTSLSGCCLPLSSGAAGASAGAAADGGHAAAGAAVDTVTISSINTELEAGVGQGEEERKGKRLEQVQVMEGRKVHGEREVQAGGEDEGQGMGEREGVRKAGSSCTGGTEESIMCGGGSGVAEAGAERMRADGQEGASREEGGEAGADYRVVGAKQRVFMSGSGKGVEGGVDRREMTCEEVSQGVGGEEAHEKEEMMVQVESGPGSGESHAGQLQGVGVAHEARVEVGC